MEYKPRVAGPSPAESTLFSFKFSSPIRIKQLLQSSDNYGEIIHSPLALEISRHYYLTLTRVNNIIGCNWACFAPQLLHTSSVA